MANYIVGIILVALLFFAAKKSLAHFRGEGSCCGQAANDAPQKVLPEDKIIGQKTLHIDGMTCINCKNRVEFLLNGIEGAAAKVNLTGGTAILKFVRPVDDDEILSALKDSGYNLAKIE